MIEVIDNQLRDWLRSVAGNVDVNFALPAGEPSRLALYAYLFEIDRPQAAPSGRTPPLQLRLGYLVTSSGPDPVDAHATLGKIIAAADSAGQYSLEFGASAAAAWSALNLPARASFVLRAIARQERSGAIAPPVHRVRVDTLPVEPLSGRVEASDGTPLVGATVEASGLGKSATTSADGRFVLEGVSRALDLRLLIRAKGITSEVLHAASGPTDAAIIVDLK